MRYRKLRKMEERLRKEISADPQALKYIRIEIEISLARAQEAVGTSNAVISVATTLITFIVAPLLAFLGVLASLNVATSTDNKNAIVHYFSSMGIHFVSSYFIAAAKALGVLLIVTVFVPRLWRIHHMRRMKVYEMVADDLSSAKKHGVSL